MSKREKRLLWAVAISIGVNLFLLGFLIARRPFRHAPERGDAIRMLHPREVFGVHPGKPTRELLRKRANELRPHHRALRDARQEARAALEAEPYDPERLEQALVTLRDETEKLQEGMHNTLVELSTTLSPEERRTLAEQNFGRKHRRRRKD